MTRISIKRISMALAVAGLTAVATATGAMAQSANGGKGGGGGTSGSGSGGGNGGISSPQPIFTTAAHIPGTPVTHRTRRPRYPRVETRKKYVECGYQQVGHGREAMLQRYCGELHY